MTGIDSEWQRVVQRVTASGTNSENAWQRMTKRDKKCLFRLFFFFFQIRQQPSTKHLKENTLNLEEDLAEGLLNWGQEQAPKKKY